MASGAPATDRQVPQALDNLVRRVFRWSAALYGFRNYHPTITKFIAGVPSFLLSLWLSPIFRDHVARPTLAKFGITVGKEFLGGLGGLALHLSVGGVSFFAFWFFLAGLAYAQRGMAFRELGLVAASVNPRGLHDMLSWYLKPEIHPENEPIRIICISGESLFGSDLTEGHRPLRHWADRGMLDVVMPVRSESNLTVSERFRRYSAKLKTEKYKDIHALLDEMTRAKEYLRDRNNAVTEHDLLCMWRVVILQNYCLVQNYFPNIDGNLSDFAPTLVYQNTGRHSYYTMYLEMFKLIKAVMEKHNLQSRPPED